MEEPEVMINKQCCDEKKRDWFKITGVAPEYYYEWTQLVVGTAILSGSSDQN